MQIYVVIKKKKVFREGTGQRPQMGLTVKITQNTYEKCTFLCPTPNY